MRCPWCRHPETRVVESRAADGGTSIRRRRECGQCNRRFTTYERLDEIPLMVVKKDGRRVPFDRGKIIGGLLKACEKRPIGVDQIEAVAMRVERAARDKGQREVTSSEIGELVMNELRGLDDIAYVRFASVYRQFKDLSRFREELERLLERSEQS